jgi:hypothetical protein
MCEASIIDFEKHGIGARFSKMSDLTSQYRNFEAKMYPRNDEPDEKRNDRKQQEACKDRAFRRDRRSMMQKIWHEAFQVMEHQKKRMLAKVSAKVYLLKRFGMLRCEVYPLRSILCAQICLHHSLWWNH